MSYRTRGAAQALLKRHTKTKRSLDPHANSMWAGSPHHARPVGEGAVETLEPAPRTSAWVKKLSASDISLGGQSAVPYAHFRLGTFRTVKFFALHT